MEFFNWYVTPLYIATVIALLCTSTFKSRSLEKPMFMSLSALWALMALLRPWGASVDDTGYEAHFIVTAPFSEDGFENVLGFSYFYYLMLSVVREFVNSYTAFLVIAAGFLALKFAVIAKATNYSICALLVYVSIFFRLHDVIQFRVGAATFFYLLAMHCLIKKKYSASISSYAASILVHSQAAVAPLTLLCEKIFKVRYVLAIGVIIATQMLVQLGLMPPLENLLNIFTLEDSSRLGSTIESNDNVSGGFRLTSVAIIVFLMFSVQSLRLYSEEYPLVKYAFYSVVAGFLLYWVSASVYTVSNRLMQFMWVPLVFMGPIMKRNRSFYFGGIGICIGFFILNGWINSWEVPL